MCITIIPWDLHCAHAPLLLHLLPRQAPCGAVPVLAWHVVFPATSRKALAYTRHCCLDFEVARQGLSCCHGQCMHGSDGYLGGVQLLSRETKLAVPLREISHKRLFVTLSFIHSEQSLQLLLRSCCGLPAGRLAAALILLNNGQICEVIGGQSPLLSRIGAVSEI